MDLYKILYSWPADQTENQGLASAELHVLLVCFSLILAGIGRRVTAFLAVQGAWLTASSPIQLLSLFGCTVALLHVGAAGLLSASFLIGLSVFVVVVPVNLSRKLWCVCATQSMLITCLLVPHLLPLLLPPSPLELSVVGLTEAYVAPYVQATMWIPPSTYTSTRVIVHPVILQFDETRLIHIVHGVHATLDGTAILCTGRDVLLHMLNVTLLHGSYIALMGPGSSLENATVTCLEPPCIWIPTAGSSTLRDVRMYDGQGREWYVATQTASQICAGDNIPDAIVCVHMMERYSPLSLPVPPALPWRPMYDAHAAALRDVAPLPLHMQEHVPVVVNGMSWLWRTCMTFLLVPIGTTLQLVFIEAMYYGAPIMRAVLSSIHKVTVAASCRTINVPMFQRSYCSEALQRYEGDTVFEVALYAVDTLLDAWRDFEELPIVTPSLRWAWDTERSIAITSWRLASNAAVFVLGRVLAGAPYVTMYVLAPMLDVLEWSVRCLGHVVRESVVWASGPSSLDAWAWRWNVSCVMSLLYLIQPLLSLLSILLSAVWGLVRLNHSTSLSTHILVALLQSALLATILYRDFKRRVVARESHQSWFVRTIATIPMAVTGMLRQYASRVATYVVLHLVTILLVIGTSVIPFGGSLYTVALHISFPVASAYGWTMFFKDPQEEGFWWSVSWALCFRFVVSVVLQKTLGDFVFHIVWEIMIGIGMAACGFLGMLWFRRRHTAASRVEQPSHETARDIQ